MNTRPASKRHGTDGFNLIEVVLALAVVSLGVVTIIGLLPTAQESARSAADRTVVATILEDVIGELRGMDYGTLRTLPPSTEYLFSQEGALTNSYSPPYFQVTVEREDSNSYGTDLQVVRVKAGWPYRSGGGPLLNTETFLTQIARYKP